MAKDLGKLIVAVLVVASFAAAMVLLLKTDLSAGAEKAFLILAGALSQTFGMVATYYFGSSAGSAEKGEQLAAIAAGKGAS